MLPLHSLLCAFVFSGDYSFPVCNIFSSLQICSFYQNWTNQSSMSNSSEGAALPLPHHQAASHELSLDQSSSAEDSAPTTPVEGINGNNSNNNSPHNSPAFSNPMPGIMESMIDSVSIFLTLCRAILCFYFCLS